MSKFAVILPAAGKSSRFEGKEKKPFTNIDGRAIWLRSAELFINREDVCQCIVVISGEDEELFKRRYAANMAFLGIQYVLGGAERFESVAKALEKLNEEAEFVAIHDSVRPCTTSSHVDQVFAKAKEKGAAILAVPVTATIKQVNKKNQIEKTLPREGMWLAQTPQVFRRDWLENAYANRDQLSENITDDAQLVEALGKLVEVVEGENTNIKITAKNDLQFAEAILKAQSSAKAKSTGPLHPFAEEDMWGGRP